MIGSLFGTGIIIGFAIAAPVGPVGVICAQRTIARGPLAGLVSGLGAAVADSIFGMFAAFGLSIVAQWIVQHQVWVRGVGGIFASTFILTMTNPITIISFAGIFAAFGVIERVTTLAEGWILVSGVFVGSCLWWVMIAIAAGLFRRALSMDGLRYVDLVSAAIMLAFGSYALISAIPGFRALLG